jgi:hypothetical protein
MMHNLIYKITNYKRVQQTMLVPTKALLLTLFASSAPILIRQLPLFEKFTYPLDFKLRFVDGHRLVGPTKT